MKTKRAMSERLGWMIWKINKTGRKIAARVANEPYSGDPECEWCLVSESDFKGGFDLRPGKWNALAPWGGTYYVPLGKMHKMTKMGMKAELRKNHRSK